VKIKKHLFTLLKICVAIASFYFVYTEIFIKKEIISLIPNMISLLSTWDIMLLLLTVFLMFDNWGFEALKWKAVTKNIERMSLVSAYKAVFIGLTFGLFAPNRIGEFAGKIIRLKKQNQIQGALAAFLTGWAQMLITLIVGIISLIFFLPEYTPYLSNIKPATYYFFCLVALLAPAALIYLYLNISQIQNFTLFHKLPQKIKKQLSYYGTAEPRLLIGLIGISLIRYAVFFTQYYILLFVFDADVNLLQLLVILPVAYLAMSFVPTITFAEIGVRSSLAISFIGLVSDKTESIFMASVSIWIINIALPALLGAFFLLNSKTRE